MAIDSAYLQLFRQTLKLSFASRPQGARLKTIALAYPDILVSESELTTIYGRDFLNGIEASDEEQRIRHWHGLPDTFGKIFRTEQFLGKLGLDVDFIDIKKIRGPERVVDLNEKVPDDLLRKYDLLIDTGTLEHCFNIGSAFKAMCEFVGLGGRIITMAPMTIINHGFWNFSPCAYYEGLTKNGFNVEFLLGRTKSATGIQLINLLDQPLARKIMPSESVIMCVAKRVSERAFAWPIQSKYEN